jgi:hypothetical protein
MSDILKQLQLVLFWFLKLLTEHLTYYTGVPNGVLTTYYRIQEV